MISRAADTHAVPIPNREVKPSTTHGYYVGNFVLAVSNKLDEDLGRLAAERFPLKAPLLMSYTCNRSADMMVDWKDHIASDPEILRGKPRIKGTRIPVGLVLGYLAAGQTAEEIIAEFSDLTRDQIAACLDYARDLAEFAVEA